MESQHPVIDVRIDYSGSVDIFAGGQIIPGCEGLNRETALVLMARYARRHGTLFMASTHPNGTVTYDLVDEEGNVTPVIEEAPSKDEPEELAPSLQLEQAFEAALTGGPVSSDLMGAGDGFPAGPPGGSGDNPPPFATAAIPDFDIEGDARRATAKGPQKRPRWVLLILLGLAMAAAACIGVLAPYLAR
ncbi:hypothetical protein [Arthrobacter sp. A2-55]|uniref:hypothetical protein n=1 Tax=Arthrobacter sp. A2-55 TaxID=2897337 RepID=UPI0021CD2D26|nr:hypothetical protein [Arthrobacter sp. A2-55]MCU6479082.1 hypothetical protein [Arthrobacter sp. A2-55]